MNLSGRIIPACVVAILLAAAAWAGPGPEAAVWPAEEWETATPESVGLDSTRLLGILEDAGRQAWRIDSIQVVRHGKLVLDAYFHPYSAGHPHDLRSVTKSVTSSLLGLSIAQGKWPDVSVTVLSQFPGRSFAAVDAAKRRMTLEHLVDMRSGLAGTEWPYTSGSTAVQMLQSRDWIGFVLDRPMADPPGTRFDYNAGNMNLLTALIGRAWRQPAREVARDQLFLPVGIRRFVWDAVDPDGNTVGESGLYLMPVDMARLGLLWLHDGEWRGRRLLPAGWTGRVAADALPALPGGDRYRRGFWADGEGLSFQARGRHGQAIAVFPALDLVVVLTGKSADRGPDPTSQVIDRIRRCASDRASLPPDPAARAQLEAALRRLARPAPGQGLPAGPDSRLSGRTWEFEQNPLGFTSFGLSADPGDPGALILRLGLAAGGTARLPCGMDGAYRFSPEPGPPFRRQAIRGRWLDPARLEIESQLPDSGSSGYMTFSLEFSAGSLQVSFADNEYLEGTLRSAREVRAGNQASE